MTTGVTNLYDLATGLLTAAAAGFTADGVSVPARQYVSVGECDSLIVSYDFVFMGVTGAGENTGPANSASTRSTQLTVWLFRCGFPSPTGQGNSLRPPTPAAYNTYAEQVLTDAYVLHRGVFRAVRASSFEDVLNRVVVGRAEPIQPQGGLSGTKLTVVAALT
jgi:hypothetical protein